MTASATYRYPDYAIGFTVLIAIVLSYVLLWKNHAASPVNFIDGDAEYYYYYLQSTFVDGGLIHYEWLKPGSGSFITHHPVGVSLLLSPFFLVALGFAKLFQLPVDGLSLPFQLGIAAGAVFYCSLGLVYLKKLLRLNAVPDRVSALTLLLLFFGTTLYHYTLIESGMSHVYSFCFISIFLYHSCSFVLFRNNRQLIAAALALGIILLLRPNNLLIVFTLLFWFRDVKQCRQFFNDLFKNRTFYLSVLILAGFVSVQLLTWALKENKLFSDRYAPYGFTWLHPHFFEMLFGFNGGFFIYAPLCLLFLFGWIAIYREQKFMFYTSVIFLLGLFYFFSCYSAYTYFDGLGIRVLVDYYAVFALVGAKLFTQLAAAKAAFGLVLAAALFFVVVNIIYSYQDSRGILLRSGMTFNQWKYVFLRTSPAYRYCLGGSNELTPYSSTTPEASLSGEMTAPAPFDFSQRDFGVEVKFDSINFNSNRIQLIIDCDRTEKYAGSSQDVMVCTVLQDRKTKQGKSYFQFRLNETPATSCCEKKEYHYSAVMPADFMQGDRLAVYLWNIKKQPLLVSRFAVKVYNYGYEIN